MPLGSPSGVYAHPPAAGVLFCNQCFKSRNGDVFASLQWLTGGSFPEALQGVAAHVGLDVEPAAGPSGSATPAWRRVWDDAVVSTRVFAADAAKYFEARGLPAVLPDGFRFLKACYYSKPVGKIPAVLAPVVDVNGVQTAIHRTFLTADC
ncbi:MAG: DUF7146 domain-containing protein, partial [Planctomycetia bacterium]